MWNSYNANPTGNRVGDCVIRAISTALNQDWHETYTGVCLQGFEMADLPSSNAVWSKYLKRKGFDRYTVPNDCPDCYTICDFCNDHPQGVFVVGTGSHAVCVIDGNYFDFWDSGGEIPLYYFEKRKDN